MCCCRPAPPQPIWISQECLAKTMLPLLGVYMGSTLVWGGSIYVWRGLRLTRKLKNRIQGQFLTLVMGTLGSLCCVQGLNIPNSFLDCLWRVPLSDLVMLFVASQWVPSGYRPKSIPCTPNVGDIALRPSQPSTQTMWEARILGNGFNVQNPFDMTATETGYLSNRVPFAYSLPDIRLHPKRRAIFERTERVKS